MALIQGSDCVIQFYVDTDYEGFVCATSFTLTTNTEVIETTTKGTGQWRAFKPNALTYSLSIAGLAKIDDTSSTAFDLLEAQKGFTEVPFRIIFTDKEGTDKILEGTAIVLTTTFTANPSDYLNNTIEMQGTGEYFIKDTIEGCDTFIPNTLLNVQIRQYPLGSSGTTTVYVEIGNITGDWQKINYSIDGGSKYSVYQKDFLIENLELGEHTISIIPVCPNGIEGTPYNTSFTMS